MSKNQTFEEKMQELELLVRRLEQGEVPLEEALQEFQKGMILSQELQKTLQDAEKTMVTIMGANGQETEMKS
ncbi:MULTISPECIES: exodeoxyribonuclease VII small subunit [unclassified Streptococcus]|uniref:exodeoxyribonuclease VII small subunit n=1 Tax=unclassified Streptococcus TaxID=2608887 RepID=UPI0018AAD947|nr:MULTISPECIES: exodeoxyribonuclease VII small subunit [unclassified Streptococcus]MBF8970320.1 exodeoxyribonuclease VII small subunit [Streptococcus sp. NLN76]MBG9367098.1 exodeoxyribonuclease VII small subunit [Streptococcus sp. NLN64]MBJ6746113.1 exodeoxyribonuclease VII small subunit [Streptococcus sp. 121]